MQERIYRDRLMVALAGTGEVRLVSLAGEDFVLLNRREAPQLVDGLIRLCARAGFVPRVVGEPPMMQTVLMTVAAGVGVSLAPGCVRSFRQPGVTFLPLVRPASPVVDLVLVRRQGEAPPTVSAWLKLVRERLPEIRLQMEEPDLDQPDRNAVTG